MEEKILKAKQGMNVLVCSIIVYVIAFAGMIYGGLLMDEGYGYGIPLFVIGLVWICIGWFPFLGLRVLGQYLGSQTLIDMGDWKNSFTVLIVPFLVSVFYIYLLRQNFLQIPNELYLAAKVDGTSDIKYLWKVMIPLALPTIISITILKMMGAWNSYMWPRLVANDEAHRLITNGLRNAFNDVSGNTDYPRQMAAVALVSLPLFLVFIFLRKYIMKGVSRSGIKG